MSDPTPTRASHEAVLPDDVTDPLLWRMAYDVARAHQPDEEGRCPSPLCAQQSAPCDALVNARRAMRLARGDDPVSRRSAAGEPPVPTQWNRHGEAA
ncbi:hypothetical protein GA0070624_4855 [Micromonospora rhizosphaerae]|uniref:Uncharacterized protein n=1 Tax=Micromonospora rhizosphaerae TaxID=568872 RepID=A0A1C6SWD6_9ACTN|nr:hypothetical protein [Micromonospora rhizosphaerae]SCL33914.1 hypothetical protein GA0070624_4855 [Micromonospora rhizosphaerae]